MRIGIDLGGSHIAIGVVKENGTLLERKEVDLNQKEIDILEQFIQEYMVKGIKEYIDKYPIDLIGIASPGEARDGKITSLVNLGIQELDITQTIHKICDLPVQIFNDAKCAALAEKEYGAIKNDEDSVFLCLGTGIGGAVFMEDKLLTPKRHSGFELGHITIQKDGEFCKCGKRGCFETYCSMKRLKDALIQLLEIPETTKAQELFGILKERQNEEKIAQKINNYIEDLVIGLSNITNIFEPEAICLGGSFVYFEGILYDKLVEEFERKAQLFNKESSPKLKLAMLGNDAGMIGATINRENACILPRNVLQ